MRTFAVAFILGNIGAHTAVLSGHVWLVIASLSSGTLRRNLGSVRLNSELTLTTGFGRPRRLAGIWIGKWSTADTTRMLTLLHAPLLSGLTTSAGKVGVITVPLSNGVMRNTRRAFNSRFLLGPRVPTHVSFWEPWLMALPFPSPPSESMEPAPAPAFPPDTSRSRLHHTRMNSARSRGRRAGHIRLRHVYQVWRRHRIPKATHSSTRSSRLWTPATPECGQGMNS